MPFDARQSHRKDGGEDQRLRGGTDQEPGHPAGYVPPPSGCGGEPLSFNPLPPPAAHIDKARVKWAVYDDPSADAVPDTAPQRSRLQTEGQGRGVRGGEGRPLRRGPT